MKGSSIYRAVLAGLALCAVAPGIGAAQTGLAELQVQAVQEAEAGKTPEAVRDLRQALALDPDWKEGWWDLGTLQYGANQFAEASASFAKVTGLAPALALAWAFLGLSEFETAHYSDALAHLGKAQVLGLKDDPEVERVAVYHLGLLLIRDSQFERATDLLLASFGAGQGGAGQVSPQAGVALGLAMLRVPLLPNEIDPSKEALLTSAGELAASGDTARFPAFLSKYPETPCAHYAYALSLEKAGRQSEAIAQLREETKISPLNSLPWEAFARIEGRSGEEADARVALGKARMLVGNAMLESTRIRDIYRASGAKGPGADSDDWARPMQAYNTHDYATAMTQLKSLLQRDASNGTGWAVLGLCEFAIGDYDDARIHLQRGQALGLRGSAESIQQAEYTLGILFLMSGDFDAATGLLASIPASAPLGTQAMDALGTALLRQRQVPGQTIALPPELVHSAGQIAALLEQSRYDEAFVLFRPLIGKYPQTPFLHYAYGTALMALSEYDQAAAEMRVETAISPTSELPWVALASIAVRRHQAAEAVEPAERAIALSPRSAEAHYLLGRAALETGDNATAMRELERAAQLNPNSPEVHFNLAKAYARGGRPEEAERERTLFAHLNELAEARKAQGGSQIYGGPRDSGAISAPAPQ